jgi:hypothetical protein
VDASVRNRRLLEAEDLKHSELRKDQNTHADGIRNFMSVLVCIGYPYPIKYFKNSHNNFASMTFGDEFFGEPSTSFKKMDVTEYIMERFHGVIFDQRLWHYGSGNPNRFGVNGRLFFKLERPEKHTKALEMARPEICKRSGGEVEVLGPKFASFFNRTQKRVQNPSAKTSESKTGKK